MINYCVEEEERLKTEKMKDVNMVGNLSISGTSKNQHESGSSKQGQKKFKKKGNQNFGPRNNNKFKGKQSHGGCCVHSVLHPSIFRRAAQALRNGRNSKVILRLMLFLSLMSYS